MSFKAQARLTVSSLAILLPLTMAGGALAAEVETPQRTASAADTQELSEIVVLGQANDGYAVHRTTTATRTGADLMDTPQSTRSCRARSSTNSRSPT
ncbi:hypothetical protein [Brevundimonas sp.]|jgi:hypothetical protein|uniref:hypothetical protein n=1 Tax=Brevundimonas sp. TaxID=1871086 RepID=UPI0037BF14CC